MHISDIFTPPQNCLSIDEIEAYLKEYATFETIRRVEKHTAECALCADAVEGFEKHKTDYNLIAKVLNDKILQSTSSKTTKRIKRSYIIAFAAAAAVALMVALSIAFTNLLNNSELAISETSAEQSKILKNEQKEQSKEKSKTSTSGNLANATLYDTLKIVEDKNTVIEEDMKLMDIDEVVKEDEIQDRQMSTPVVAGVQKDNLNKRRAKSYEKSEEEERAEPETDLNMFLPQSYKNIQHKVRLDSIQKFAQDSILFYRSPEKLLIAGIYWHQQKQYDKAQKFYTHIETLDKTYTDEAIYLEAILMLDKDKKRNAKQMFKDISKSNSKYKQQAADMLILLR